MSFIGILVIILTILLSMTLHEAMHAFTSNWLGDDTARLQGRLTLNPLAHIDPFGTILLPGVLVLLSITTGQLLPIFGAAKPVPFNPFRVKYAEWGAAMVALAGPATNLVLAGLGGLSLRVILSTSPTATILTEILVLFVYVNLGFFAFNILPIPPLDGSRLLYAVSPEPIRQILRQAESYSLMFVFAIIFFAQDLISLILGGIMNPLFVLFVGQPLS